MPNRNQIIIFSVLGLIALLIGYFKNPLKLSMGDRAEVQGPVPPTIVTNVIPFKQRTISRKDIIGTYELKAGGDTLRFKFLDNAARLNPIAWHYRNGKKNDSHYKWSIVDNEIHVEYTFSGVVFIYRLNPDNSITRIAMEGSAERTVLSQKSHVTYKKITKPNPAPTRILTLEEKDIVGTYEYKDDSSSKRMVLLDDRIVELYYDGKNVFDQLYKWKMENGEIHFDDRYRHIVVHRINKDKSITRIAYIRDGKREDLTNKKQQWTYKKIN